MVSIAPVLHAHKRHPKKASQSNRSAAPSAARKNGPDFSRLRYFGESGWLGYAVVLWGYYFKNRLDSEMYGRFNMLPDEFSVLASLYDCGTLTAKTICDITGRPKNSVGRGVRRLIASGRIKSVTNPDDRREAHLSILPEGRKLYERLLPLCRERERKLMQSLTTEELVQFDRLLMKIILAFHVSDEGIGPQALKDLGIPDKL
jgi:DNA-binding MarR family transcriptional regulator